MQVGGAARGKDSFLHSLMLKTRHVALSAPSGCASRAAQGLAGAIFTLRVTPPTSSRPTLSAIGNLLSANGLRTRHSWQLFRRACFFTILRNKIPVKTSTYTELYRQATTAFQYNSHNYGKCVGCSSIALMWYLRRCVCILDVCTEVSHMSI